MNVRERAFPTTEGNYETDYSGAGMSLRDYFAAQAMNEAFRDVNQSSCYEAAAKDCYLKADAMMKARGL